MSTDQLAQHAALPSRSMPAVATPTAGASRLLSIDMLRGIAALAVVFTHLPFSWNASTSLTQSSAEAALPQWAVGLLHYGANGVNLFLVISGFCIHMQWARQSEKHSAVSFLDFWKRRLRRLYPPYFVALALSLLGLAVLTKLSGVQVSSLAGWFGYDSNTQFGIDVLLLLLLAHNLNDASRRVGNPPFWSLALEEQLYLLYFPFLALRRRWNWTVALVVVTAVTLLWRLIFANDAKVPGFWYVVGPARWLEWTLGALAVESYLGKVQLHRFWRSKLSCAVLLGVAVAVSPPDWYVAGEPLYQVPYALVFRELLFSLAGFVLINIGCDLERLGKLKNLRPAQWLGEVGVFSYSLYLVHNPAQIVAKRLALTAGVRSVTGVLCIRLLLSLVAGYVFYRTVELFFINRSRKTKPLTAPVTATLH
jgi:peptidoglycan/LPS O-acetylase OafA/YrhL